MRITSGTVVDGHVVFEGELPEGSHVTLLADDREETFEVTPELKAVLLESIAQCERGETISAEGWTIDLTGSIGRAAAGRRQNSRRDGGGTFAVTTAIQHSTFNIPPHSAF
jgi:hypothetical protein